MIPIQDLFEVHLTVRDLDRAIAFYRDRLGLLVANVIPERGVAFFWLGAPGNAMLGLWSGGDGPQQLRLHTAFRVSPDDIVTAPRVLRAAGITPLDFNGEPTDEPVVLAWMPALSLYFHDPDGNLLEYISMLPHPAQPERGVVKWSEWNINHS